ncbi:MAG: glucose 1-dehydrogenase [Chloroflexi bacterium]|nr:glucose 1-dehydrogenase [Chloroflexota bacterium]
MQQADRMQAVAVTPGRAGSARLVEVPQPAAPGPGEALVRVLQAGVCGTDVEITGGLYGAAPAGDDFLILGHESFGVVEDVGPDVHDLAPGDYVAAMVRHPDDCPNCRRGEWDMCIKGDYRERGIRGLHGFMRPYYVERTSHLVLVPAARRTLGVLMEPLSIVEKGLAQIARIQDRMHWEPTTAVVLGAGPIGLLATAVFRVSGYRTFTVARTPRPNSRADLVEQMGAVYLSTQETPVSELGRALGQIDVILEATGNGAVAFEAVHSLGTNGILCLTSVTPGDRRVEVPADTVNMRLVLGNMAVFGAVNANRSHFEQGVRHLEMFEQLWPGVIARLITHRFPLADFAAALEQQQDRESIKVVLDLAG